MAKQRHKCGEICSEEFRDILAWGWCDEADLKEGLNEYWEGRYNVACIRITNITHVWLRFVPAPPDDPDEYTGYYHIARPNSRGATQMTQARIEYMDES